MLKFKKFFLFPYKKNWIFPKAVANQKELIPIEICNIHCIKLLNNFRVHTSFFPSIRTNMRSWLENAFLARNVIVRSNQRVHKNHQSLAIVKGQRCVLATTPDVPETWQGWKEREREFGESKEKRLAGAPVPDLRSTRERHGKRARVWPRSLTRRFVD